MMPTYGRVKPGEYLALINSFGVLEIARAEGNAAEGLGTDRGAPVMVREAGPAGSE
jgi:S-adenosylmethionine hydrolase